MKDAEFKQCLEDSLQGSTKAYDKLYDYLMSTLTGEAQARQTDHKNRVYKFSQEKANTGWFTNGCPWAQASVGFCYQEGFGVAKNDSEAVKWYLLAAGHGNCLGQNGLGYMYETGRGGLPQNDKEAVQWYLLAVEQHNSQARTNLRRLYEKSEGVSEEVRSLVKYYYLANEQNDCDAQVKLGDMYRKGFSWLPQDDKKAIKWYQKAIEQNHSDAQYKLGWMYRNGRGVAKDVKEAVKWFNLAAEQEHGEARNSLGIMYANGQEIPKDEVKAKEFFRLAAEKGHSDAECNLGVMYANGRGGLTQSIENAIDCYVRAADKGSTTAQQNLVDLSKKGYAETIEKARLTLRYKLEQAKVKKNLEQLESELRQSREQKGAHESDLKTKIEECESAQQALADLRQQNEAISKQKMELEKQLEAKEKRLAELELPFTNTKRLALINYYDLGFTKLEDDRDFVLGTGSGFGTVYRGVCQGKYVAIKKLDTTLTYEALHELIQEASVMMSANHPRYVVQCYGITIKPYTLVMEYMIGGDLHHFLHSEPYREISWQRGYEICLDISEGLHYLHSENIIHGDLKVANVLLNEKGQARLADFGGSKVIDANMNVTLFGKRFSGTVNYLAPEIFQELIIDGNNVTSSTGKARTTLASDIYSLGTLFCEITTRKDPLRSEFANTTLSEFRDKVCHADLRERRNKKTQPRLKKVIKHCWFKEPQKRPPITHVLNEIKAETSALPADFANTLIPK